MDNDADKSIRILAVMNQDEITVRSVDKGIRYLI